MRRTLPALVVATVVAVGMVGALALATGEASSTFGQRAMPASGPPGVLPNVILDGAALRPATAFSLRGADGTGTMGTAEVEWAPQGEARCPDAPVPLGGSGTELDIAVDADAAFAGRIHGRLYAPHPACERAVGIWRGTGGTYEGRDGGLVVVFEPGGAVRVVLSP